MDVRAFLATTLGKIVLGLVGVLVTVGIAGVSLYAMDYGVEATVVAKDCTAPSVTVQETWTRLTHTQAIGAVECTIVQRGNFVLYNIQSERIRVWENAAQERLLWDSTWLSGNGGGGQSGGGALPFMADAPGT